MKKFGILLAALVSVLILAEILVVTLVDLEAYKPIVLAKVHERISGKLELGKIRPSIWTGPKIWIESMRLADERGRTAMKAQDVTLRFSLLSLLAGQPKVQLRLDSPVFTLIKDKSGPYNVQMLLAKPKGRSTSAVLDWKERLIGFAKKTKGKLLISGALVEVIEEESGRRATIDDADLKVDNIAARGDISFEASTELRTIIHHGIRLSGLASTAGIASLSDGEDGSKIVAFQARVDLSPVDIAYHGKFNKHKGAAFLLDAKGSVSKQKIDLSSAEFRLGQMFLEGNGSVAKQDDARSVDLKMKSNRVDLGELAKILPRAKSSGLDGTVEFSAHVYGLKSDIQGNGNAHLSEVTWKPKMTQAASLMITGDMKVDLDRQRGMNVDANAKGFDSSLFSKAMKTFLNSRFSSGSAQGKRDIDHDLIQLLAGLEAARR
ncbi:MAG: hypothetical protein AB1540_01080 [Bdellovibrionota bacterium]